jgi:DNA-binding FrmR family transcriptional regulator
MVDEEAECRDIVTQLAAAKGALDRVGFKLMSAALADADPDADMEELEKLFLKLS